jgi:3-oxoadipate enol-lactonase
MHAFVNGVNINYLDKGTGTPIVLVHGFPFSHEMWTPQIAALASAYRVIAYDVRGHGLSDVGDGQYTMDSHVDDLFALMDHLSLGPAVIVGLSMGGYITLRALDREQKRFRGAVLCDTRAEADSNDAKFRRFASITGVKRTGSAPFAEAFVKGVFAPSTFSTNPAAIESIRRIIERTPPLSIAGTLLALASRPDMTATLAGITIPVLIIVGEQDATTPPEASGLMHSKIAGSTLQIIPGAAHMSNLEQPALFNQHLQAFLRTFAQ